MDKPTVMTVWHLNSWTWLLVPMKFRLGIRDLDDSVCWTFTSAIFVPHVICLGLTAIYSWYPRVGAQLRSGLNVSEWTSECENWFETHCKNILRSQMPPLSGPEWWSTLCLSSKAPKLTKVMEAAAKSYITNLRLTHSWSLNVLGQYLYIFFTCKIMIREIKRAHLLRAIHPHWVADEWAFYFNVVFLKSISYSINSATIISNI